MIDYEQIIAKARSGDHAALQLLYHETVNSVWYIVSRLVDRHEDAEDLVQDTFVTAFASLDQLVQPQAFPKWVHRIATNTATNHLKKKRPVLFATDEQEEQVLGSIPAVGEDFLPEEFAVNQELRDCLMSAIAQLPEKQRMAIFLHYYEGTAVKELAETLNVGENTVKSRLNAGRAGIRKHLEKMGISGVAMTVLAFALRNDAAAASVPQSLRTTVWAGVRSSLATAATAATASTTATTTAASACVATAAKTGIFSSLWVKVTAAVVATALVAGGGVAVVKHRSPLPSHPIAPNQTQSTPFHSQFGIPEEMGSFEDWLKQDTLTGALPLLTHPFEQPIASYEFDGFTLHYYSDGYMKIYLRRGLFPTVSDNGSAHHFTIYDQNSQLIRTLPANFYAGASHFKANGDACIVRGTTADDTGALVLYLAPEVVDMTKAPASIVGHEDYDPDSSRHFFTKELVSSTGELPQAESVLALDETLLNLTDVPFGEVTQRYGRSEYISDLMYYHFPDADINLAYAYGKSSGCNYVTCSLDKLIPNCPETLTVDQLTQIFGGGSESYSEMEDIYLFSLDYKGGPLGIYKNSDGQYGRDSIVWHNCANRVKQASESQSPSTIVNVLEILGKTRPEIESILGHTLTYGSEFGGLEPLVPDFFTTSSIAYMSGPNGSGTCIGFSGVPLRSIIPNCPASMSAAQLKAKLGDTYKDPWSGSDRFDTMYNGFVLTIFPSPIGSGIYTSDCTVIAAPATTTLFGDFGTYWNNSCENTEAHMEILSKSASTLTCIIDMGQRTYGMRVTESGRITLSSTDGVTYRATGLKDSWQSVYDITITFDDSVARVAVDYTQMASMANYCFDASFLLHRGS